MPLIPIIGLNNISLLLKNLHVPRSGNTIEIRKYQHTDEDYFGWFVYNTIEDIVYKSSLPCPPYCGQQYLSLTVDANENEGEVINANFDYAEVLDFLEGADGSLIGYNDGVQRYGIIRGEDILTTTNMVLIPN